MADKYTDDDAQIYLRDLDESDITDEYLRWFWDESVTYFLESKNLSRDEAVEYFKQGWETGSHFMYAIVDKASEAVIGTVKIGPVNRKHMISDLVTLIGNRSFWGRGIASEAIRIGNGIAFNQHGIRKLNGGMYEDNIGSIKAYLKGGWVIEGRLVGQYLLDDKVQDRVVVSCFNPDYFRREGDQFVLIRDSRENAG